MKKTIKELAEQAALYSEWASESQDYTMDNSAEVEKFAELILQECAIVAQDYFEYVEVKPISFVALKRHFGLLK